jgi:hypothetical protein
MYTTELIAVRNLDALPGRFLVPTRGATEGKFPVGTIFLWDGVPSEDCISVIEKDSGKKFLASVFCGCLQVIE